MTLLRVYSLYFRFLLLDLFVINTNVKTRIALFDLFNKKSFRIPIDDEINKILLFRYFYRSLTNSKLKFHLNSKSNILIYDANIKSREERLEDVSEYKKMPISKIGFFSKYETSLNTIQHIAIVFIQTLIFLPVVWFCSLFNWGNRAQFALLFFEVIESIELIVALKKTDSKIVHYYCPYEKDANLNGLLLDFLGIQVVKHPSAGPLLGHNKFMICDTVAVSNAYHLDEIKAKKDQYQINSIEKWPPNGSSSSRKKYQNINLYAPKNTIGYISTATHLRFKKKNNNNFIGGLELEEELISKLKLYMSNNAVKLNIYLHPKEKKDDFIFQTSKDYYYNLFGVENITFITGQTTLNFHLSDIMIGTYSTVLFERLYCGFKTMFYSPNIDFFPIKGTSMSNIIAQSEQDIISKLDLFLKMDKKDYFTKMHLRHYVFFDSKTGI